jgi:hypothetical protein
VLLSENLSALSGKKPFTHPLKLDTEQCEGNPAQAILCSFSDIRNSTNKQISKLLSALYSRAALKSGKKPFVFLSENLSALSGKQP